MHVTHDYLEFKEKTGIIFDRRRLRKLGLYTDDSIASFYNEEVYELFDFCATNPEYHIVTILAPSIYVNRYDRRSDMFQLADGDKDPNYMLDLHGQMGWVFEDIFNTIGENIHLIQSPDIKERAKRLLESADSKPSSRKKK